MLDAMLAAYWFHANGLLWPSDFPPTTHDAWRRAMGAAAEVQRRTDPVSDNPAAFLAQSRFMDWWGFCVKQEGPDSDDPGDPGGYTHFGVTVYSASAYCGRQVSGAELSAWPVEQCAALAHTGYWNGLGCWGLPLGVDFVVCDHGWNAGQGTSARILQRVLGVTADGQIGPITRRTARNCSDQAGLLAALHDAQLAEYRLMEQDMPQFAKGWENRLAARFAEAVR